MAKKIIRFPLKMKNGAEVRTIEELRENFDIQTVLKYYLNGQLYTWLSDRYYTEEAEAVKKLMPDFSGLASKLCKILKVQLKNEISEENVAFERLRNHKINKLRQYSDNSENLRNVDITAFDQKELNELISSNQIVYLFGKRFSISASKSNIKYIGINNPVVDFEDNYFEYKKHNISLDNVQDESGVSFNSVDNIPVKYDF